MGGSFHFLLILQYYLMSTQHGLLIKTNIYLQTKHIQYTIYISGIETKILYVVG